MIEEGPEIPLLLLDILRGYSKITYKSNTYFLKHFRVYDSLELLEYESESVESAIKRGIKSKKQLLEKAIERKVWSKEEESSIKNLEWMISKSEKASSKISDYMVKKSFEKSIKEQRDELDELNSRKSSIIMHSAENLASRKRNKKEIGFNLFKDEKMETLVDEDDIYFLMPLINEKIYQLSKEENLITAAFNPSFFDTYCLMYRQPHEMIGVNVFTISLWQKNLIFYASVLLNKLKNLDVPDDVREDPVKLFKFSPKEEKDTSNNVVHGVEDLRAKMAEKGGKLGAEDF